MSTTTAEPALSKEAILDTLEDLIEITRDGAEGFSLAAEHATHPELKDFFRSLGNARAEMVRDLQDLERFQGQEKVDTSGSVTGSLHRAWINIRTAVTQRNDQAILEEAERGEDAALEAYEDALSQTPGALPESALAVIRQHLTAIKKAHDDVRGRRDSGNYQTKDS